MPKQATPYLSMIVVLSNKPAVKTIMIDTVANSIKDYFKKDTALAGRLSSDFRKEASEAKTLEAAIAVVKKWVYVL